MLEVALRDHLNRLVDTYAKATCLAPATVTKRATKDARFLKRLGAHGKRGKGASFIVRRYDEIVGWFSLNWPHPSIDWPDLVVPDQPQPQFSVPEDSIEIVARTQTIEEPKPAEQPTALVVKTEARVPAREVPADDPFAEAPAGTSFGDTWF